MMVGISKEDVLSWYQGLNASHRVEIICALLDHSLPFELRFLGSVIENLGRKDFHVLRDAECRANSLHSSETVLDQSVILKLLNESPIPVMSVNPQMTPCATGHPNNASEVTSATRPNISQTQDKTAADENKGLTGSYPCENGLSSKISPTAVPSSDAKGTDKPNPNSNTNEANSEDEGDQKKEIWLHDWTKRRKLILYLSLLAATNHDSANLYYILMSDVEDLMENLGWLEELEEHAQDEILLLYTVGSHHPAFNFEQRTFLSAVLNRFKECMTRYSKNCEQSFHGPCPPNQILNHHYLPPQHFEEKVGYYFYANPTVQNIQSSQSSSSMQPLVGSSNSETVRAPTYPFQYPSFPVFMSPPHPQHPASVHHQQYQPHQYPSNMAVSGGPTPASVLQSHQLSQHGQLPPSSGNSQNTGAQLPGKVQITASMSSNPLGPLPNSHQSSVSTPTRTSSLASAVTAYQSQANSLDGDSEGSSENCAWDSPESSPFESPPQSLTPSRSQSPRTGFQSKSSVHASTTMHGANITGHVASSTTLSSSQPRVKPDVAFGSSSNCTLDQGTSTATTVTISRPNHKSNIPDRKGRLQAVGGPSHNNVGQLSYSSPHLPPSSSSFSNATVTTTTSTASLTVTTVTSTPSAISSPLGKSQSLPTQSISHSQSTNLPVSHSAPQTCSTSNVSYSNLTSSGDCAQAHKNVPCSNSSGGLVTVGISSSSVSIVNTSAYNNSNSNSGLSISSPISSYPIPLPQHHLISPSVVTASNSNPLIMNSGGETFYNGNPPAIGLVNAVNAAYGSNMLKSSSTMHSQSPQGRQQQKTNATGNNQQLSNNHGGVQSQQSQQQQQHVIQQLMGQVVGQLQTSSNSVNNVAGVVTHSMNTPLLSYGHPGGHNNHGHANYSAYQTVGVSYGNMGAPGNYRPNSQGPLLNRPAAYITSHPGSHLSNQMVMKQQQDQRGHSGVHPPMRQKNPSVMQGQNTPKRRTNNSAMSNVSSSSNLGGNNVVNTSSSVMLQSQSGKSEEATELNDRTNNVLVVSANPSKNAQHQQDNRGKIYHHPNSGYSNGPVIIDRVTSSGGISSSNSNTNPMMNSASGNSGANIVANTTASGQPLHNTQLKGEENLLSDGGVMEYGVATVSQMPGYHSSLPLYGHPGPNAAFIPMQNGYLTPSYYPNHVAGPAIGMNTSGGPPCPPSTEILMNPGHMQSQYPFTFPFTIPPPHYGNPNLNNKAMCANNPAAKDASKTPLTVMGTVGSSVPNDSPKLMVNVNEPTPLAFGRPGPPTNTQSATIGGLGMTSPLLPMPSHSPMSTQAGRPRGVILEVGGQTSGAEFPTLTSLENALMPPLDDPLEVNCRPRKISCYNCGSNTHVGPECKEASMEEMTRKQYRLNYGGPPSSESKEGE